MSDRDRNSVEAAIVHSLRQGDEDTPLIRRVLRDNQLLKHNFGYCHSRKACCALEGCGQPFEFILIPGQIIYPKYCEEHRSTYRRELFRRRRAREKRPEMGC